MKCLTPTDKKKTESDILLEAGINIRAGITEYIQREKILKTVAEWYGVDCICHVGIYKKQGLGKQRRICMYLLHEPGDLGYDEITEIMGQKSSINVMRKIEKVIVDMPDTVMGL